MNPTQTHHHPLARFVSENIIPAVGAVVLALIIRSFAIQPFTIPTGSMEPTLHGDYTRGDKILADKGALAFSDPERLDVVVFKFPEDVGKKRDFIKRLVGMPGEAFEIRRGDVYINGDILRKPLHKQKGIWAQVDVADLSKPSLSQPWATSHDMPSQNGSMLLDGRQQPASLWYNNLVANSSPSSSRETDLVGDLMAELKLALVDAQSGEITITLQDLGGEVRPLRFSSPRVFGSLRGTSVASISFDQDGATCSIQRNGVEIDSVRTALWSPDEFHSLEFSSYDDTVNLILDGEVLISEQFTPSLGAQVLPASLPPPLGVTATNCRVALRRIGLHRDVYWTNMAPWGDEGMVLHIPQAQFVVLGDNSPSSEDSRRWMNSPFVPRENLVARASVIFWPPQRWRLIP